MNRPNERKSDASPLMIEFIGDDGPTRKSLAEQSVSVGRHATNAVPVKDTRASRFHCVFWTTDGQAWVRDLNSSNGTFLNGKKIATAKLSRLDVVRVGQLEFVVVAAGDPVGIKPDPPANVATIAEAAGVPDTAPPVVEEVLGDLDDLQPLDEESWSDPAGPPDLSLLEDVEALAPEALDASDVVELDAGDVVGDDIEAVPDTVWSRSLAHKDSDDGPIPLATDDVSSDSYDVDSNAILEELAASLPDKTFAAIDIALAGARGQIVHPAGKGARSGDAVDLFRRILVIAARGRVTDIHIEPRDRGFQVRMRVDGTMISVVRMASATGIRVQALVKVLSEIDLAERNSVQEGHFSAMVPSDRPGNSRKIDYRVSFAPSVFGQKLVMRILDATYAPMHVRKLCLPRWMQDEVESALRKDSGMMLVCGPTGSGKTNTLYALVRGSNVQQRNAITIEDPIEMQLESVTQTQVDDEHDKGFAALLRSVLRQDPDVIMVGEIRDAETARIAMQAALTGHLVFSTIHTRDTVGTIFRLLDLDIEPYLVAQALHLVVAQRLVRQLCPSCKTAYNPPKSEIAALGEAAAGVSKLFRAVGCPKCLGTGYWGRKAFFELLTANDALKDVIVKTPTLEAIQQALRPTRFQSLRQSGYQLVADGSVAFPEIDRIAGQFKD